MASTLSNERARIFVLSAAAPCVTWVAKASRFGDPKTRLEVFGDDHEVSVALIADEGIFEVHFRHVIFR